MSEIQRVRQWFRSRRLVRPSSEVLNFVDLVHALAILGGVENIAVGPGAEELRRLIGRAEHYVVILVDGMGVRQLEVLSKEDFLRSSVIKRLQSVFLSTTASVLTTLGTGHWPGTHGVPGWWTYLQESGIRALTLPFNESSSGKSLLEFGISPKDFFPVPSFWPNLKNRPLSIMPQPICDTIYSNYITGGTLRLGYTDIRDAFEKAAASVLSAPGPSFTYLYLPQLDTLCHRKGTGDRAVRNLLQELDRSIHRFTADLAGRARIVITADHGQTDIPRERMWTLEDEAITSCLCAAPSGEPNVPIFHVIPGREIQFAAAFHDRFGNTFALLTPEEIEDLHLLGPHPLSRTMKSRLGTFTGIAAEPAAICAGPPEVSGFLNVGSHGGLTPAEMFIPLIIPKG